MIAIKGLKEMPSCCYECPYYDDYCRLTSKWEATTEQIRDDDCPLVEIVTYKDSPKQAPDEDKIEQEIRENLEKLTTYRIYPIEMDFISLNAVKRVLNLVFRGSRDLESNICDTNPFNDSRFGG